MLYVRIFLLFALSCLLSTGSFAQAPKAQWAKCYGGSRAETARSIIQDKDGNFVFAGGSSSSDGDVFDHHGGLGNPYSDFWIVKLDDTGKLLWEKSFGGKYGDNCNKIIQTSDGGYLAIGTAYSRDGDAYTNHDTTKATHVGTSDMLAIKINKDGIVEWEKCYGGTNLEYGDDVQQTHDGGYIMAGMASSTDGDVKGIHFTSGTFAASNMWVVKIDATGRIEWQKCLGGNNTDEAYAIKQTSSNYYLVCGITSSTSGDVTRPLGGLDAWALKLDDTGKIVWQQTMGGSSLDEFVSIVLSPDGNYVFGGSTQSNDSTVSGNHPDTAGNVNSDVWVVKTDTNGNMLWQKLYGGSSFDGCREMQGTNDSGFIINGMSSSWDGDVHFNHDADSGYINDLWVLRLNAKGDTLWERVLGGTGIDVGNSITQTNDSFYIAAGGTDSKDGDVIGNKYSSLKAWVVRLSDKPMPGTGVPSYTRRTDVSVYPNPSTGIFVLQYRLTADADLLVTDLSGKIVYSSILSKNKSFTTLNGGAWQPGIYFYKITQEKNIVASGKLLKQ